MCMGDFRLMPLFQDSKFLVKNVGARAHCNGGCYALGGM